jgi:hypothetical protein
VETGEELEIRVDERACQTYLAALAEHQTMWREAARACGVGLIEVAATEAGARLAVDQLVRLGLLEVG